MLAEARADGGLTGRSLAQTGGQDAAHEDLLDLLRRDARAFDGGFHRSGAQVGGLDRRQRALEAAHRGAGEGADDDGISSGGHDRRFRK